MLLVLRKLRHSGKRYNADDVLDVELSDREVTSLVDAGAIKVINEKREEVRVKDKPPTQMKSDEAKTQAELASMKPQANWAKPRLLGLAKAKGLEVDEAMTRDEIYKLLTGEELKEEDKKEEAEVQTTPSEEEKTDEKLEDK